MNDELIKTIANDLGIQDLPADDQRQIVQKFGDVALKAASAAVLGKLSADKQKEFMNLGKTGDAEALQTFLERELPNHAEIARLAVEEEVSAFKAAQAV